MICYSMIGYNHFEFGTIRLSALFLQHKAVQILEKESLCSVLAIMIVLLSLLAMVSHGMKLPGQCPNPPFTQHLRELNTFSWIFGVPFSDETPSQIFRNIDNSNRKFFEAELFSNSFYLAFNRTGRAVHRRCEDLTQNRLSDDKQISVTIEEQHVNDLGVYTHTKCPSKLIENIRIWHDDEFTIIWSCVNFTRERGIDLTRRF